MVNPVEIVLVPTLMIVLGYMLKKTNILKEEDSTILSTIVLKVSLPSLILVNMATANITSDMIFLPLAGLLLSFFCLIISYLYCKFRGFSKVKTWTIMIASSMANTGFLGFPICLGVFGNEGFLNAIFFDLSTTLLFIIFGMTLVGLFGGNMQDVLKQAVGFIPLWAVIMGLIINLFNIPFPYVIESSLNYLGQATIPLIMMSLGLTLNFRKIKDSIADSLFVVSVKLIVAPIIMFLIMFILGFSGLAFKVAVLEAGMATALNALVLAINYDLDIELMSSLIFIDMILCLFTLTVIIGFLI